MDLLRRGVRRAVEAADLTMNVARDVRSRAAMLSCYAAIVRDPYDRSLVEMTLAAGGARFPITMRKSDLFTLAEVFHAREYDIQTRVPSAPTVLDCGANVGLSGIWFLARYPGARLHCFEPEPENFSLLSANLGARPDTLLHRAAVGNLAGRADLHVSRHGAMHSINPAAADHGVVAVDVVNLADYMRRHEIARVDILKLDVEGSEHEVVKGMADSLDHVGIVVGEVHEASVDERAFYAFMERRFRVVRRASTSEAGVHMFEMAKR